MSSWLELPQNTDFTIENIPFGIFSTEGRKRVGTRVGDHVLDLELLAKSNFFSNQTVETSVFSADVLNPFISLGKEITSSIRTEIQNLLRNENSSLRELQNAIIPVNEVSVHLPVHIGDYTDFYSSLEHATNVGTMFRDPDNALFPNWKHLPVGYHGRSSSILVSGENIHRPNGQTKPDDLNPVFGPSKRVDFELEMGFVIGKNTNIGDSVSITEADDYIFGMVLFNDWSARDVQKWEYVPLGPFLAKSFASSMSPWIVTMEALEPFTVAGPDQDPQVLPYLQFEGDKNYDIKLEVGIQPENSAETVVSKSNFKFMYWNMIQQLAHHTSNGCNISVGDLMASGTISGKDETSYGSMLELAWAGKRPLTLNDGSTRVFINDSDTVTMRGYCEKGDLRVGFGEVTSKLLPSK